MKNKAIVFVLVISLIITICGTGAVFATANPQELVGNVRVLSVEEKEDFQKVVFEENGNVTEVEIIEEAGFVKTVMTDKNTDIEEYFYVDKENNTLYSSVTGKTISLEESNKGDVSAFATAADSDSYRISYKTMYNAVGKVSEITTVASLMLTMLSYKLPYPLLTTVALLVSAFSATLTLIMHKVSPSSSGGAQLNYKKVTYTKHQAGHVFHTYKYKVTGLSRY